MIPKGIQTDVSLGAYTTMKVGGRAEYFAEVTTPDLLEQCVHWAKNHVYPLTVLGGGSNVVVDDAGVTGLVIRPLFQHITIDETDTSFRVAAGAGVVFDALVALLVEKGIWGLENLSGIPGSVGATPVQNVGAYGIEVSELIESVTVYNVQEGKFQTVTNVACDFTYRDSRFKRAEQGRFIITEVTFSFPKNAVPRLLYKDLAQRFDGDVAPTLSDVREAVLEIRAGKFPDLSEVGTAGSFFKNPIVPREECEALLARYEELPHYETKDGQVKLSLGWILDRVLGLRGYREGNVGLCEKQALVLINYGGATAADIESFAGVVTQKVHDETGLTLEWEVRLVK